MNLEQRTLRKNLQEWWRVGRFKGGELWYDGQPFPYRAALQAKIDLEPAVRGIVYMNLDGLFEWILKERATMTERLFRVELRIDIIDDETYEKFKHLVLLNSRSCFANAKLLNQSPIQPQIAIITNDGFIGQKDIEMFEDLMAPNLLGAVDTEEEPVSSELLAAVANRTAEKNQP